MPIHIEHRFVALATALIVCACGGDTSAAGTAQHGAGATLTAAHEAALADTLRRIIARAYAFSDSDVVAQLMSLYPDRGPVVSASSGRVTSNRDSVEAGVRWFWEHIGQNMRNPTFTWGETHVQVLSPNAAVLTGTYTIPHRTPRDAPHVVGGAWTAVFERRDGRWVIVHEHLSDATPTVAQ
jgi:ketosteroid isomerase-like protein